MDVRPLGVGLILFGLLALGGTIDGARRKFVQQPVWMVQNWRSALKGIIGWLVIGLIALFAGGAMALL